MIIKCYNCNKSFSVKDVLIPITGRLLECGKCKNRWFYKPNNLFDDNLDKNDVSDSFVFDNPEKKKEKESYKFETIKNNINY